MIDRHKFIEWLELLADVKSQLAYPNPSEYYTVWFDDLAADTQPWAHLPNDAAALGRFTRAFAAALPHIEISFGIDQLHACPAWVIVVEAARTALADITRSQRPEPLPTITVRLVGWHEGLQPVSLTRLLQERTDRRLAAARAVTDALVDGCEIELDVLTQAGARHLAADLTALGVKVALAG